MNHWKKKLVIMAATSGLLLAVSTASQASYQSNQKTTASEQQPTKWLFTLLAKKGKLVKRSDGLYDLILAQGNLKRIIAFSDRPVRQFKSLTGKQLGNFFNTPGKNSFEQDPPNAILAYNGSQAIAVEIMKSQAKNGNGVYTLKLLPGQSQVKVGNISNVALFIDGTCMVTSSAVFCSDGPTQAVTS